MSRIPSLYYSLLSDAEGSLYFRHDFLPNACFSRLYTEIFLKKSREMLCFQKDSWSSRVSLHNHVTSRPLCKGYAVVTPRFFHVKSTAKNFFCFWLEKWRFYDMEPSRTHTNFSTFPSCKGRRPYAYTCLLLCDTSKTVAARSRCSVRSHGSDPSRSPSSPADPD